MAFFVWNDSYSVGVEIVDEQHKKIFIIINKLHEAMKKGIGKDIHHKIIHELKEYSQMHFYMEERYFDKFGYPKAIPHKREHKRFIDKISDFDQSINTGKKILSIDIMIFLKDWMVNHILVTDKKYSDFFHKNGLH
ncbi:MAG: hypothetical protein B6244_04605 [Candidatus Cloacimonetes bacterium 4572_55]|nr:MAG: hypothetical protein B6244_04605 [Candidatus Cloacimonetes bacterium 4572_55]